MNAEQLSVEVYEKLVSLDYTRKPNSFREATQTNFNSLSAEIKEAINSFLSLLFLLQLKQLKILKTPEQGIYKTWVFTKKLLYYSYAYNSINLRRNITS